MGACRSNSPCLRCWLSQIYLSTSGSVARYFLPRRFSLCGHYPDLSISACMYTANTKMEFLNSSQSCFLSSLHPGKTSHSFQKHNKSSIR